VDFTLNHIVLIAVAKDLVHGIYELLLFLVPSLDLYFILREVSYHRVLCPHRGRIVRDRDNHIATL
jgi:hypothetical protein